jgi:3-methyladenine DNA glycosylase AlkD
MPGLDSRSAADAVERELRAAGTAERAAQEKRYLKSSIEHLGADVPAIRGAVGRFRRAHPGLGRGEITVLVDELWGRGIFDLRFWAVELLVASGELLGAKDVRLLERLLRTSHTWALVDGLAVHCLGPLAERDAVVRKLLPRWGRDPDFWIRRSALLAHLLALRDGRGDLAAFGRIADPLLEDREFFIRKAIGWILRDTGKRDPAGVAAWLLPRAARASPLTVREALKYLPAASAARIRRAAAGYAGAARQPRTRGSDGGPSAASRSRSSASRRG